MEILILTEPIADGRFRARAGEPIALTAEGNTREEATRHLEALLRDRLRGGGAARGGPDRKRIAASPFSVPAGPPAS